MTMTSPVIISCAVTGGADTKRMNPAVPVSPAEIAAEALAAHDAGAAIIHIHVRDPETGTSTPDPDMNARLFAETTNEIGKQIASEPYYRLGRCNRCQPGLHRRTS